MGNHKLHLKSGGYLHISGLEAAYVDANGTDRYLKEAEQTILAMLVSSNGHTVSYQELYEGYSRQTSFGDINQMVADIKTYMYPELKACIRVVRGKGYRLDLSKFEKAEPQQNTVADSDTTSNEKKHRWMNKLVGDYYGFMLDSVGDGAVLGMYIHIENIGSEQSPEIIANAILGIQSDSLLFHNEIPEIFRGTPDTYYENYHAMKEHLDDNDRRCYYGKGAVTPCGTVAAIPLITSDKSVWTLMMDMDSYLVVDKFEKRGNYYYRGGKGLLLALTLGYGKYCCKCGLIRKEFVKPSVSLKNPTIRDMLAIFNHAPWMPLELDGQQNREWYNWFMKEKA